MKITRLVLLMLALTVSTAAANLGGSFGSSSPGEEPIGGSNTTACTWYFIDCETDGVVDDWCCGSYSSCKAYCEQFCGVTCHAIYGTGV